MAKLTVKQKLEDLQLNYEMRILKFNYKWINWKVAEPLVLDYAIAHGVRSVDVAFKFLIKDLLDKRALSACKPSARRTKASKYYDSLFKEVLREIGKRNA